MKILGISYAIQCFICYIAIAQVDLEKHLVYHNKNQEIEYIYFFDEHYKIVRGPQKVPGPLPVYLMNQHNLIVDTLDKKLLPEILLFAYPNKVFISSMEDFWNILIEDERLKIKSREFTTKWNKEIAGEPKVWKRVTIEGQSIGLQGRTTVVYYDSLSNTYRHLISERKPAKKISNQRMLNVNYFYMPGYLIISIIPYQSVFRVSLLDLHTTEFRFPDLTNSTWYYFFDHITKREFAVREIKNKFSLYELFQNGDLRHVTELITFPTAVVSSHVHYAIKNNDGTSHYLVPILFEEQMRKERDYFKLEEIIIKN